MKRSLWFCLLLVLVAVAVVDAAHHETQALIDLDKEWGSAQGADAVAAIGRLIADDAVVVSGEGIGTKADLVAEAEAAEPQEGPYVAGDYKVTFLNDSTAVMTHSAGEPDPHWSLHVWQKRDGAWQVVASMSTPIVEPTDE